MAKGTIGNMKSINFLNRNYYRLILKITSFKYKKIGKKSCIFNPMQIDYPKGICIGNRVFIAHYAWLMGSEFQDERGLVIGDGTTIGHFVHIIANKEVIIENDVLIADKVFISDCSHIYRNSLIPIQKQGISFLQSVHIGEGSWLGENVCICGANIGKHCVIGANSVVINDIPDYCVAAGSPAKVIKKYDKNIREWISV